MWFATLMFFALYMYIRHQRVELQNQYVLEGSKLQDSIAKKSKRWLSLQRKG
jgi:hypothetical protein